MTDGRFAPNSDANNPGNRKPLSARAVPRPGSRGAAVTYLEFNLRIRASTRILGRTRGSPSQGGLALTSAIPRRYAHGHTTSDRRGARVNARSRPREPAGEVT